MRTARIGADIGGTFTDLVLLDSEGKSYFAKISSTPEAPEKAVLSGVAELLRLAELDVSAVSEVLHGTTVGSNTLLQQAGARTGLITTKGFRDVLEIGRLRTSEIFNLAWDKPEPLVSRRFRREVDERVDAQGKVLARVSEAEILQIGSFFKAEGISSVAICFINSYVNPDNELEAERLFRKHFPEIFVTSSVSVLPEAREYERTSTTAVNAYVLPVLREYLNRLDLGLKGIGVKAPLLVCNSNGGLSNATVAREKPVFFITSGRAAGVTGASRLGQSVSQENLIVFDMGGTTASASLINRGKVSRTKDYEFRAGISTPSRFIKAGGYLMRVPTIDVAEVGSGAGSIAGVDAGGLVYVGPTSAGAFPGPVCYGIGGTKPTVTDANVVLGLLPGTLAGGKLKLDTDAARHAIAATLADPLGLSVEHAALGVRDVVNANMARAIRAVTVERGVDPRDFCLVAFGGSGPVHACDLARSLGIRRVLFPRAPGVFTALGMLAGSVERYFVRAVPTLLSQFDEQRLTQLMEALTVEARKVMETEGYGSNRIELQFELEMRYRGQDSEIPVVLPQDTAGFHDVMSTRFSEAYKAMYGYKPTDQVEVVNLRLLARGIDESRIDFTRLRSDQLSTGKRVLQERKVYLNRDTGWISVPVIDRAEVSGPLQGPLILQSIDSTIVVPPNATISLDEAHNIVAVVN